MEIRTASTPRQRLRGLMFLREPPPYALKLSPCRSVHTCFMRFPLDLHWLDEHGATIRVDRAVRPWRMRSCRRARAILEVPCRLP